MPDKFIPIANTKKIQLSAANGNSTLATEYIFTNRRTFEALDADIQLAIRANMGQQTTIFDFL